MKEGNWEILLESLSNNVKRNVTILAAVNLLDINQVNQNAGCLIKHLMEMSLRYLITIFTLFIRNAVRIENR